MIRRRRAPEYVLCSQCPWFWMMHDNVNVKWTCVAWMSGKTMPGIVLFNSFYS